MVLSPHEEAFHSSWQSYQTHEHPKKYGCPLVFGGANQCLLLKRYYLNPSDQQTHLLARAVFHRKSLGRFQKLFWLQHLFFLRFEDFLKMSQKND